MLAAVPRRLVRAGAQVFLVMALILNTMTSGASLYVHLPIAFAAGAVLYLERGRVPLSEGLAAGAIALTALSAVAGQLAVVAPLTLPYVTIWIGLRLRVRVTSDLSYGVYIYGWPIQQLLAMAGVTVLGVLPYFTVSLLPILLIALASWSFVEAPALRLRRSRSVSQKLAGVRPPATV